jgi:hypothetical protein
MDAIHALVHEVDSLKEKNCLLIEDKEFLLDCARLDREEAEKVREELNKYKESFANSSVTSNTTTSTMTKNNNLNLNSTNMNGNDSSTIPTTIDNTKNNGGNSSRSRNNLQAKLAATVQKNEEYRSRLEKTVQGHEEVIKQHEMELNQSKSIISDLQNQIQLLLSPIASSSSHQIQSVPVALQQVRKSSPIQLSIDVGEIGSEEVKSNNLQEEDEEEEEDVTVAKEVVNEVVQRRQRQRQRQRQQQGNSDDDGDRVEMTDGSGCDEYDSDNSNDGETTIEEDKVNTLTTVIITLDQVLRDLESVGANNRSHDLDRQLSTVQQFIDVITQNESLQVASPYSEDDDMHTWGRVCVLISRLLSAGVRAAKRSTTFTTSTAENGDGIVFHCKFRDNRGSSLVENCIVGIHTLSNLPYVPISMDDKKTKDFLTRMGKSKNNLTNSQFFAPGMTPEDNSWPDKMSEMIMQITIEFLKKICLVNNDNIVATSLIGLLLVNEPRVPSGGSPSGYTSGSSRSAGLILAPPPPPPSPTINSKYNRVAEGTVPLPPRSPMRNELTVHDFVTSSPSSLPFQKDKKNAVAPLARFVVEVVDELIQPAVYGGLGGPSKLFSNIPVSEFLKLLSLVYKQNKLECMAAMDAILEYTCQCRHEEFLMVVELLSSSSSFSSSSSSSNSGGPSGNGSSAEPDELEKFTMSKVKETAKYWRDIELVVIRVQRWYKRMKFKMMMMSDDE